MVRGRSEAPLAGGSTRDTVRQIRSDAPPGEDTAGGLWAIRGGTCETAGEETSHIRFPRFHAHLYTQPEGEVHGEYEDDEEASPTGPDGSSRMVPGAPP